MKILTEQLLGPSTMPGPLPNPDSDYTLDELYDENGLYRDVSLSEKRRIELRGRWRSVVEKLLNPAWCRLDLICFRASICLQRIQQ